MTVDARKTLQNTYVVRALFDHLAAMGRGPGPLWPAPGQPWMAPSHLKAYQVDAYIARNDNIYILAYMPGVATSNIEAHYGLRLIAERHAAHGLVGVAKRPVHYITIIDDSIIIVTYPPLIGQDGQPTGIMPISIRGYDSDYSDGLAEFFAILRGEDFETKTELGEATKFSDLLNLL